MGDLFDYENKNESELGTEEKANTSVVAQEKELPPYEGKSYTFRTQRYKAEDRPCIVNENNRVIPLDDELAMCIVNSVSRAASLYGDITDMDNQVELALSKVLPDIKNGVIPEDAVTAENVEEARKIRTELNRLWENLEKERKSGKKIIESPRQYIEDIYKAKTKLLTDALATLKSQIDKVDSAADEKKKAVIRKTILDKALDYNKDLPSILEKYEVLYNKVWKDSFLNKTMTDTKMQREIMEALSAIADDLKTIEGETESESLRFTYFETGNLAEAIKRRQRVADARKFAEELEKRSHIPAPQTEEKKEEPKIEPISVPQEKTQNAPQRAPEIPQVNITEYGPGKHQYFHCWNANPSEFDGLYRYMKDHGFKCEGIGKIVEYYRNSINN